MRLLLVRHGQAHAGFTGPIAGETGCAGLTDHGRRQAEALRDHLASSGRVRADVLLASTLPRAIQTAELIAPGLDLPVARHDRDLREVDPGEADGMDWADYNAQHGPFDMEAEPERPFAPGGESWNGFHERVRRTLGRLVREHDDQTVVAVCHAGVIMASLRLLLGIGHPDISAQLRPDNTGITEWEHVGDRWTLRSYNEAVHLIGLAADPRDPSTDDDLTVEGARAAAEHDDLNGWVHRFLASPGSDNAELGQALTDPPRAWLGPVLVGSDELHRLAGAPGEPVLVPVDEDEWRDDVEDLARRIDGGFEPAPVIATHQGDHLRLEDGNHRLEALRRAGREQAWTVIGFANEAARARFEATERSSPSRG